MSTSKPAIAFAGLGAMGYGMAVHLLKSGFRVIGYDVHSSVMGRFAAEGGISAPTPREAVKEAEFLICMVANSAQATLLLFDDETGAIQGLPSNATIIMCATVAPAYIAELRKRLDETRSDVRLIDSPVSGGSGRAANGTLSIFSSGQEEHLANAHPILACVSSKLYRVEGGLGGGSKAKLIHVRVSGVPFALLDRFLKFPRLS